MRQYKRPHGAWLQGQTGTWGAVQGRQGSERRDGQWRQEVVDPFPGEHEFQDQNMGDNQVQKAVQLSLRVTDGGNWAAGRGQK